MKRWLLHLSAGDPYLVMKDLCSQLHSERISFTSSFAQRTILIPNLGKVYIHKPHPDGVDRLRGMTFAGRFSSPELLMNEVRGSLRIGAASSAAS